MATAAKRAAKKTSAAPAIAVGTIVKFLGYPADVAAEDQILEANGEYEVLELAQDDDGKTLYVVAVDNPEFDEAQAEDAESNPSTIETEVYGDEIEFVAGPEAAEEVAEEVVAAPAPAAKAAKGKTAAKAAPAAAAPAAKGKAAAKTAAAPAGKGKAVAKGKTEKVAAAPKEEVAPVDPEALPELENEDADVAALVDGSEDLVATAQELESNMAKNEYQLGGILYHLKKGGAYKETDPKYAEKGGWALFIADNFNVEYRKAQWLIEIYVNFNLAGIENAAERVAEIGWTKASKISKLVLDQDPEELLTLAAESTVAELQESVTQSKVTVGGKKGEVKKRITLKFSYFEDEGKGVLELIEGAKEQHGLGDLNEALSMIVNEWATQNAGEAAVPVADAPAQKAPVGSAKAKAATKPVAAKARARA